MARKKKVVEEEVNEVNEIKEKVVETAKDVVETPVEEKIEVEEVKEEETAKEETPAESKVEEAPKKAEKDEVRPTSLADFLF